jgi:hypothetical protein
MLERSCVELKWLGREWLLSSRAIVKQLFSYCEVKVIILLKCIYDLYKNFL